MRTFSEFLENKVIEEGKKGKKKKHWIQGAHLKKGRCTPFPNPDCPEDSPQGRLAKEFKSHKI